eukprot:CAMPEP_0118639784 /NCGR_PEP_ID=MMETSP0785-20121206/4407_1 /TAXON_ID=91992 /ORGANISM="Bolidomonas pacifica, Strain CCMP 1866" /LENGTH=66 /DNA_ID=CAMNT_0006531133 /DNA_START=515 /DNA_END=715 /DNA_ORIENTATION=-
MSGFGVLPFRASSTVYPTTLEWYSSIKLMTSSSTPALSQTSLQIFKSSSQGHSLRCASSSWSHILR